MATLALAKIADAYVFILDDTNCVSTWPAGTIPIQVKLANMPTLTDGSNYRSSVLAAMDLWNGYLGAVQLVGTGVAPGSYEIGNGVTEIVMDSQISAGPDSFPFDPYTLALTIPIAEGNFVTEADMIFNTAFQWDSFRRGQISDKQDIRRVAAHELGHVLGLDHPDEAVPPQYGYLLMNSIVSYSPPIEGPQPDDVEGVQALYGSPGFTPANDDFADAIAVSFAGVSTTATVYGTNVASTKEAGEPDLDAQDPGGRTVWWKWIAPVSGILTVTTQGSNFDTLLGAYKGDAVNALTQVASNDDAEQGVIRSSTITFDVDYGVTYYLAVDGWGGYVGSVQLNLSFALDPNRPPPKFAPPPLTRNAFVGQAVIIDATAESNTAVTYSWTKNGVPVGGLSGPVLSIPSAVMSDTGLYEVTAESVNGVTRTMFQLNVLNEDLTAVAWGGGSDGVTLVPEGLGNLLAVSAGYNHVVALKADGTVAVWGNNYNRQLEVPAGLSDVVAISAGWGFSLALQADGKVIAWGDDQFGAGVTGARVIPPADLDQVIAISAGAGWGMALRANGEVVSWGEIVPVPQDLQRVIAIAAGPSYALALQADRTVVEWGGYFSDDYPVPVGLTNVTAIAASGYNSTGHSLARRSDGTVVAWGYNYDGEIDVPQGLSNVVGVGAGNSFSLALKGDGSITGWGRGYQGALDIPAELEPAVAMTAAFDYAIALVRSRPPSITAEPEDLTVQAGDFATFAVSVTGTHDLHFQWWKDGVDLQDAGGISGTSTATLEIDSVTGADAGAYSVVISNLAGAVESGAATLTVLVPPQVTARPGSGRAAEGDSASFTITTVTSGPLTYTWRHNRQVLEGASGASLNIGSVSASDAGYYEVTVADAEGGISTGVFYLNVSIDAPSIVSWGDQHPTPPEIDGPITSIAFKSFGLVLRGDGTVVSWGGNQPGQADPPLGLTDVVAISVGIDYALALKSDGTVVGWGKDDQGQATPPPDLTDVVAISAGYSHSLALRSDGTVVAWGNSSSGATAVPSHLKGIVAIEAGNNLSYALRSDGTIVSWGFNPYSIAEPPEGTSDIVAISAGTTQQLALRADGTVVSWGSVYWESGSPPSEWTNVTAVATGEQFDLGLLSDGRVIGWGRNYSGEITIPEGLSEVVAIAAGGQWGVALTRTTLPQITSQPAALDLAAGEIAKLSVTATGSIPIAYQWRLNGVNLADGSGVSGATAPLLIIDPVSASNAGNYDVVVSNAAGSVVSNGVALVVSFPPTFTVRPLSRLIGAGQPATFTASATDPVAVSYQWRHNGTDIPGANGSSLLLGSASYSDAGYYEVVASNSVASARSVFHVDVGPVGSSGLSLAAIGESWNHFGPTNIPPNLGEVVSMATGMNHSLALRADGTVVAWGTDSSGATVVPSGLSDVVQVAVGDNHSLVLLSNGRVRSWGNWNGMSPPPVPADLYDVVAISVYQGASMALKSDGTIVTWGLTPPPAGLDHAIAIGIGAGGGVALKSDGTVATWSAGFAIYTPPPPGLGNVVAISAGPFHCLALKGDGTVIGWGTNSDGQLSTPAGLTDVAAISAGWYHSAALRRDGTVVSWGSGYYGQTADRPDLAAIGSIAAGSHHTLVLTRAAEIPTFLDQPRLGNRVAEGSGYSIYVIARGVPAPSLQWFKDGVAIPGKTGNFLELGSISAADAGTYTAVATNSAGEVSSIGSVLTVLKNSVADVSQPLIDPVGGTFQEPKEVSISCSTAGATIRYKTDGSWPTPHDGTVYTGPFTVASTEVINAVAYADGLNDSWVSTAYFTIVVPSTPLITTTALPRAIAGKDYSYSLAATGGDGGLTWTLDGGSLPSGLVLGSDGKIAGIPTSTGSSTFTVRVADSDTDVGPGDEDTHDITLTADSTDIVPVFQGANLPRGIVGHPYVGTLIGLGGNGALVWSAATGDHHSGLSVSPTGIISGAPAQSGSIYFTVWVADSDNITGPLDEGTSFIAIPVDQENFLPSVTSTSLADAGLGIAYSQSLAGSGGNGFQFHWGIASGALPPGMHLSEDGVISGQPGSLGTFHFTVKVDDDDSLTGSADEGTKPLTITVLPSPRLVNVSMRAFAGGGDDTLIVGFSIVGAGIKTVVIRGVGPKLLEYGVPDVVSNPSIRLYRGNDIIAENDNWYPDLASDFQAVGAFPLDFGSKDAALKADLAPGGYTIHLINPGTVAEALVEVYDESHNASSRLVNVSSRLKLASGANAILGTAVTGGPINMLARNVGPGISQWLVNPDDALSDPFLRLYAGDNLASEDDDWDVSLTPFFNAAGAFPLTEGSKDAAIRAQFQIGGYTVHATGVDGSSGITLIEIYESP